MGRKKASGKRPVLALVREKAGDSRAEMAETLEVTVQHLGGVETGKYPLGKEMARAMLTHYRKDMKKAGVDAEMLIWA
jgi:DNA-binding XRE family transcriptional regulator